MIATYYHDVSNAISLEWCLTSIIAPTSLSEGKVWSTSRFATWERIQLPIPFGMPEKLSSSDRSYFFGLRKPPSQWNALGRPAFGANRSAGGVL